MTEQQISAYVDRMLDHLNRLVLNGDMPQNDYHAAILELAEWEEAEMRKLRVRDEV